MTDVAFCLKTSERMQWHPTTPETTFMCICL